MMGFLGLANLYAMRVNLSVAIVAMTQGKQIYLWDPIIRDPKTGYIDGSLSVPV